MSIANFDSEREARRFLNKHLRDMHGGRNPMELGFKLTVAQLDRLHLMMHMDGLAFPPHHHAAEDLASISNHLGDQGMKELIETILEAEQE